MIKIQKTTSKQIEKNIDKITKVGNICFKYNAIRYGNKELIDLSKEKGTIIYLVKHNQKIIGYMVCFPKKSKDKKYFYLSHVAILDKYRGKGIGYKLFKRFINEGREQKYKRFRLHSISPAILHFCDIYNFKRIRRYKEYIGKQNCNLMELVENEI